MVSRLTRFVHSPNIGRITISLCRRYSDAGEGGGPRTKKGLVLGVYYDDGGEHLEPKLTPAAEKFNQHTGGKLEDLLKQGVFLQRGKSLVFQNLDPEFFSVALVGLGKLNVGYNPLEDLDECKENVRCAAAEGAFRLRELGVNYIFLEGMGQTECVAEGAGLAVWRFQDNKNKDFQKPLTKLELYMDDDRDGFQRGLLKAECQNLARKLTDLPANQMTPASFSEHAVEALCPCGVSVEVRDRDWIEKRKMYGFLAVARGSCEPPLFLEMNYCGGTQDEKPVLLLGKGVTFDTGGLCLKTCAKMEYSRADMAGGAVIVATMRAVAALSLPINVSACIALCENMPSGMAMKPGDVVVSMSGKTIQIENTDNEGRLILADTLTYGLNIHKPRLTIDLSTTSRGIQSGLGAAASGVFTNSNLMWKQINKAGSITGDRVWRFPLWDHFSRRMKDISSADIRTSGSGVGGYPCKAAAFLKEFVTCGDWIHLDISGTGQMSYTNDYPYLIKGRMTGRPTRTVIQLLYQLACMQQDQAVKDVKKDAAA